MSLVRSRMKRERVGAALIIGILFILPITIYSLPESTEGGISIDGSFGDWAGARTFSDLPGDQEQSNVDLLSYSAARDDAEQFFMIQTRGDLFAGFSHQRADYLSHFGGTATAQLDKSLDDLILVLDAGQRRAGHNRGNRSVQLQNPLFDFAADHFAEFERCFGDDPFVSRLRDKDHRLSADADDYGNGASFGRRLVPG